MQSAPQTPDRSVVRALHRRVVCVFDFDRTLADRTTDQLLRHLDVDPEEFEEAWVTPRVASAWNKRLAEAEGPVELSRSSRGPITAETFAEVATEMELCRGSPTLFDCLTTAVQEVASDVEVEFHLLTAGFVEIPSATPIADRFEGIVGCRWAYDDAGAIAWPAYLVGHYDKVGHLLAIAKGLDSVAADRPDDIDRDLPEGEWHVPFEQMIHVGDGDSDLPAFDFMQSHAGVAIGVYRSESPRAWQARPAIRRGRQVSTLLEADYGESSALSTALYVAARRAALRTQLLATHQRS